MLFFEVQIGFLRLSELAGRLGFLCPRGFPNADIRRAAASVSLGSEPTLPVSISQFGVEWLLFENWARRLAPAANFVFPPDMSDQRVRFGLGAVVRSDMTSGNKVLCGWLLLSKTFLM